MSKLRSITALWKFSEDLIFHSSLNLSWLSKTCIHTFTTYVNATLSGNKVVVASSTTRILKLLTHLGDCVKVVARYGGRTPAFVQGIQT